MDERSPLEKAIEDLGGQAKTAAIIKKSQPTLSGYIRAGNAPADVCMRIEVATGGKFTAEQFRPDLADVFVAYRARRPGQEAAA